ncbi:hypothetical protein Cni_G02850 [Canna indica]|uniref:Uncharacterized protein n=1 Tax=Canna indica TaxID=4628 RepID=A0AAQ3Q0T0_9LILI|nr:hypothetical protein Cni_G02850 [Canna indica]
MTKISEHRINSSFFFRPSTTKSPAHSIKLPSLDKTLNPSVCTLQSLLFLKRQNPQPADRRRCSSPFSSPHLSRSPRVHAGEGEGRGVVSRWIVSYAIATADSIGSKGAQARHRRTPRSEISTKHIPQHLHECGGVHWSFVLPPDIVLAARVMVASIERWKAFGRTSSRLDYLDLVSNYSQNSPLYKLESHIYAVVLLHYLHKYYN